MPSSDLPASAAWRHHEAREGFESVFLRTEPSGYSLTGTTAAVEDGIAWVVGYDISLDDHWITRTVRIWALTSTGEHARVLRADGPGRWRIDGRPAPELDGCLDVDLESSACTNTIPVHRLGLRPGETAAAPAVYVRAVDLRIERLEQEYARPVDHLDSDGVAGGGGGGGHQRYGYRAPRFDYDGQLVYDQSGLVIEYPGIAVRVQ